MRLIIAGGRGYWFNEDDHQKLLAIHRETPITEVVSGKCKTGADRSGERWAESMGIEVKPFPADWDKFGLRAGPIRNTEMAQYADALAIFPGGSGSADMLKKAKAAKLKIYDFTKP